MKSVSIARRIAFDILRRVTSEGAYASELLFTRLGPRVSRADAALATELTLGVLRWQRLLDFLLLRRLKAPAARSLAGLDPEVLIALRLGLYQLRFLERVPQHAAVDESVELVKRARKRSAAALVNAVLRSAAREAKLSAADIARLIPPAASEIERTGILHSHPDWLVERWMAAYGRQRTIALLESDNRPPRLSCAVIDESGADAAAAVLRASGFTVSPGRWLRQALTISGGNPATAEAFRSGRISVQDEASQMVARLADARPGQTVLDLCAAPGGKTLMLARAVAPAGMIIASDLHAHRVRLIQEQLQRTRTANVQLLAADAAAPLPFSLPFDRILLDAPCSGTGTLARNPEIRWRLQPEDLARAHRVQAAMLKHALTMLAPGGRLVYSTCSLEAEENEQVVAKVLAAFPGIRAVSGRPALEPHLRAGASAAALFDARGDFRTFPPESVTDGFFAAILER